VDADKAERGDPDTAGEHEERADLDLRRIGGILRRRVRLMLLVFVVVVGLAAAITWLMPPTYEAEVTALVQQQQQGSQLTNVLGELPLLGGALGGQSTKTQELLLEHPDLTEQAAKELGIATSLKDLEYAVDAQSDPDSNLVRLTVQGRDPGKAADLANRITDLFMAQGRRLAQETPRTAADYVMGELRQMEKDLGQSEDALRRYQAEHGIADIGASITASIERAATLQGQADAAGATRAAAQQAADYYRRKLAREHATYIASSTIARNPVVQKLETDLSDLQEQRAAQTVMHGPEHPEVRRIDKRIREATAQLSQAMATVIEDRVQSSNPVYLELTTNLAAAEAEAQRAAIQETVLNSLGSREMQQMSKWPDMATELGRLKRNASVDADLYVMLMKNYQQMRINEAVASSGVTVVSHAKLPEEPIRPQKALYMALGTAVALLLALLACALAEALDDRLRTEEQVERALKLPTLAVIPAIRDMEGHLLGHEADPAVADQFRLLRTNLRFASRGSVPAVLLVTSPGPSEGKTSVAFGLGIALAQGGQRVLVVDADLRQSAARKRVALAGGAETGPGLSSVLATMAGPMEVIRRTSLDRLSFLPAGDVPPNPVELLDSTQAQETFAMLREHFDAIVVDSPPCPVFVETVVTAALCDATLVVLDASRTRARDARATVRQLSGTGRPLLGAVLNRVRTARTRYSQYYASPADDERAGHSSSPPTAGPPVGSP